MINKFLLIVLALFISISIGLYYTNLSYRNDIDNLTNNNKAYRTELVSKDGTLIEYRFKIEELHFLNDSISKKMVDVQNELNIKNKQLKRLEYINMKTGKTDTINIKDTIFVDNYKLDTVLGDKWYNLKLNLHYPNTIIVNPTFNNELFILTKEEKKTIDPPKKFFICRWFQRKHTIRTITIYNENPYSEQKEARFVEIIE